MFGEIKELATGFLASLPEDIGKDIRVWAIHPDRMLIATATFLDPVLVAAQADSAAIITGTGKITSKTITPSCREAPLAADCSFCVPTAYASPEKATLI